MDKPTAKLLENFLSTKRRIPQYSEMFGRWNMRRVILSLIQAGSMNVVAKLYSTYIKDSPHWENPVERKSHRLKLWSDTTRGRKQGTKNPEPESEELSEEESGKESQETESIQSPTIQLARPGDQGFDEIEEVEEVEEVEEGKPEVNDVGAPDVSAFDVSVFDEYCGIMKIVRGVRSDGKLNHAISNMPPSKMAGHLTSLIKTTTGTIDSIVGSMYANKPRDVIYRDFGTLKKMVRSIGFNVMCLMAKNSGIEGANPIKINYHKVANTLHGIPEISVLGMLALKSDLLELAISLQKLARTD